MGSEIGRKAPSKPISIPRVEACEMPERIGLAAGLVLVIALASAGLFASIAFAQPGTPKQPGGLGNRPGFNTPDPTGNDYASVRLISERQTLRPDRTNWIALDFEIAEDWHLYWKFAGDTGLPPGWSWTTPEGVTIGEPIWPVPKPYSPSVGFLDYIYENRLTLLFPVVITADAARAAADNNRPIALRAEVEWLVCKDVCLPGDAQVSIELRAAAATTDSDDLSPDAARFAQTRAITPLRDQSPADWGVSTEWQSRGAGRGPNLLIRADNATALRWYPDAQSLAMLPFDRYHESAGRSDTPSEGVTLNITYRFRLTTANATTMRGILEIERGGSKVWLDLHLPPPPGS